MLKFIIPIILTSVISANVCEEVTFHSGSVKDMDTKIEKCEQLMDKNTTKKDETLANEFNLEDIIVVTRLVNIYPNDMNTKKTIITAILKYSKEYKIDAVTLCALIAKESSMNINARHSSVIVKIPVKKNWTKIRTAKVTAVGTGGVIFEIWRYELNSIGISSRKELFDINTNIKASAFILGVYTHERKQLRHTKTKEESGLLRYYGVKRNKQGIPNKTYSKQVYKIRNSIKLSKNLI